MRLFRTVLLLTFLLLAGFVIFCMAMAVHAAPSGKKANRARPVVKIGRPYLAELRRPIKK